MTHAIAGESGHSLAALERLRELPAGGGGRVLVVRGDQGPWYAGLRRAPAETLLEAVLTFLVTAAYADILVVTGTGHHLPAIPVGPALRVGLVAGAWYLRGAAPGSPPSASPTAPPTSSLAASPAAPPTALADDPDLLDIAAVKQAFGAPASDRVALLAQNAPWAERVTALLALVEERCGLEWRGTRAVPRAAPAARTLVVVDDRFLLPRPDELRQAPAHQPYQSSVLGMRWPDLMEHVPDTLTDVVVLASSGAPAAELHQRGLLGAALAHAEATPETQAAYPGLAWKTMQVITAPALDAAPHGRFHPEADRRAPLSRVLRTVPPRAVSGPLEELDRMIGLSAVKHQVRGLVDRLREDRERRALGLPVQDMRLHTVFYGNPGTGKTTVARLLARIFSESGLLSGQKVTEVSRADLVGQYLGETTQKTARVCREALGGVLFIDEAYALHRGEGRDYGTEAVDELVKWMSDRPSELAVILAGYPREMREFIANANPGLVRRFDFHLAFDDYTDDELAAVVAAQARREQDELDAAALDAARERILQHRAACASAGLSFGNAGDAVRLLQAARRCRTARIRLRATWTRDDLARLLASDFERADLGTAPAAES